MSAAAWAWLIVGAVIGLAILWGVAYSKGRKRGYDEGRTKGRTAGYAAGQQAERAARDQRVHELTRRLREQSAQLHQAMSQGRMAQADIDYLYAQAGQEIEQIDSTRTQAGGGDRP